MKFIKICLPLLLVQLLMGNISNSGGAKLSIITLYYIPFDIETFLPITPDLIEGKADCVFRLDKSSDDASILKKIFNELVKGEFQKPVVRLKIIGLGEEDIFLDRDGGVLMGKATWHLTDDFFFSS